MKIEICVMCYFPFSIHCCNCYINTSLFAVLVLCLNIEKTLIQHLKHIMSQSDVFLMAINRQTFGSEDHVMGENINM